MTIHFIVLYCPTKPMKNKQLLPSPAGRGPLWGLRIPHALPLNSFPMHPMHLQFEQ